MWMPVAQQGRSLCMLWGSYLCAVFEGSDRTNGVFENQDAAHKNELALQHIFQVGSEDRKGRRA